MAIVKSFYRTGAIAAAGIIAAIGLTCGCAVRSLPISRGSERLLKANEVQANSLGFRFMPGGERYVMQLFRARLPREPFEVEMERSLSRLPAARVSLNGGKPILMIVDTGAQLSVVEASRALEAKAKVFAPSGGVLRVTGVGGDEKAWLAQFDSARLGPTEFNGLVTVLRRETSQLEFLRLPFGSLQVNLLGSPVLAAFSYVTFDFSAERFAFSGGTPFVPTREARRIPLTMRESLPYVTLRIGGREIPALVDTGARDQLFLNDETVRKWGMEAFAKDGRTFKAAGLGGTISGTQFKLPLVHVGDVPVRDVVVDTSSGPWPARIGSELLERWRVTFDYKGRALWLEPAVR